MEKNRDLFEKMPVGKALATLAVPTIISQLITMVYNLADTFFIGIANDPAKTAASSVAFALVFLMNCLSNLFGVGGGSLISRLLGEKRDGDAKSVASFSFWGSLFVAAIYSVVVALLMEPILYLIGAEDASVAAFAADYTLWVVIIGAIPTTLGLTMSHLLRSEGYAKHASIGLAAGGILNIALDPLFMFVFLAPGNEVKGAAIATLISNVAVLVYFLAVYFKIRKKSVISLSPFKMLPKRHYVWSVLAVGFPSALGTFLASLSSIMVNKLVSGYGKVPLAAMGIVKKIDMLPLNVGMGLCQGMMPLVAYNYASGNYKRMKAFSDKARLWGMAFAAVCIVAFELLAGPLVRIFITDTETVALGEKFLKICCLAVPLMIMNFQMAFTFQAMGKGKQSLLLSSLRQGLVNIPLLLFMNYAFGLYGVVWTQLISDIITAVISMSIYMYTYKRLKFDVKINA